MAVMRFGVLGLGIVGGEIAARLRRSGGHVVGFDTDHEVDSDCPRVDSPFSLDCDVVIECLPEDLALKAEILGELPPSVPVLSTTSALTITELGDASGTADRLGGFHFLPAQGSRLAEVVFGEAEPLLRPLVEELAGALGLDWVGVDDRRGRISRRLLVPFVENVLAAQQAEIASAEDIDLVVRLGLGHREGPLARLRRSGLEDHRRVAQLLSDHVVVQNISLNSGEVTSR